MRKRCLSFLILLLAALLCLSAGAGAEENAYVEDAGNWERWYHSYDQSAGLRNYRGEEKYLRIPSRIDERTVTEIGERNADSGIFGTCALKEEIGLGVIIPDTVRLINNNAFAYAYRLESIEIPSSVLQIGKEAFKSCISLKEVRIPASVRLIGKDAFNTADSYAPERIKNANLSGREHPLLIVDAGSYAEQYCLENDLEYRCADGAAQGKDQRTVEERLMAGEPLYIQLQGEWKHSGRDNIFGGNIVFDEETAIYNNEVHLVEYTKDQITLRSASLLTGGSRYRWYFSGQSLYLCEPHGDDDPGYKEAYYERVDGRKILTEKDVKDLINPPTEEKIAWDAAPLHSRYNADYIKNNGVKLPADVLGQKILVEAGWGDGAVGVPVPGPGFLRLDTVYSPYYGGSFLVAQLQGTEQRFDLPPADALQSVAFQITENCIKKARDGQSYAVMVFRGRNPGSDRLSAGGSLYVRFTFSETNPLPAPILAPTPVPTAAPTPTPSPVPAATATAVPADEEEWARVTKRPYYGSGDANFGYIGSFIRPEDMGQVLDYREPASFQSSMMPQYYSVTAGEPGYFRLDVLNRYEEMTAEFTSQEGQPLCSLTYPKSNYIHTEFTPLVPGESTVRIYFKNAAGRTFLQDFSMVLTFVPENSPDGQTLKANGIPQINRATATPVPLPDMQPPEPDAAAWQTAPTVTFDNSRWPVITAEHYGRVLLFKADSGAKRSAPRQITLNDDFAPGYYRVDFITGDTAMEMEARHDSHAAFNYDGQYFAEQRGEPYALHFDASWSVQTRYTRLVDRYDKVILTIPSEARRYDLRAVITYVPADSPEGQRAAQGILPRHEKSAARADLPFYVMDALVSDYEAEDIDLKAIGEKQEYTVVTDPKTILRDLEGTSPVVSYDDGARVLLTNRGQVFAAVREGSQAVVQAEMVFANKKDSDGDTYRFLSFPKATLTYGKSTLFVNGSVYLMDWDTLEIYRMPTDGSRFYGTPNGRYYLGIFDSDVYPGEKERVHCIYAFDLQEGACWRLRVPMDSYQALSFRRVTDEGAVLYSRNEPFGYFSLADRKLYATSLSVRVLMTGDDYYVLNTEDEIKAVLADGSTETLLNKAEFFTGPENGEREIGSANNLIWLWNQWSKRGLTFRMGHRWADGYAKINREGKTDPEQLFPSTKGNSMFDTAYSSTEIYRVGHTEYRNLNDTASMNFQAGLFDYTRVETDYGWIFSPQAVNRPGTKLTVYQRLIPGRDYENRGYQVFHFDENQSEMVTLAVADAPDLNRVLSAEAPAYAPPAAEPTAAPTAAPTAEPTAAPTAVPTAEPAATPAQAAEDWGFGFPVAVQRRGLQLLSDTGDFSIELFGDYTAAVILGGDRLQASWNWRGASLTVQLEDGSGKAYDLAFDNGQAVLLLDGRQTALALPEGADSFLESALGFVPYGVNAAASLPVQTPAPTERPVVLTVITPTPAPSAPPTPPPTPAPTAVPILRSIPGKPGYLQVLVQSANATSWIVGKDPTAYTPARMIDGEETTSFQFSTKTTKLGKEYIYFTFSEPVALDEMWIKNGFWKITNGLDQYTRNCRVKKMTMDFQYAGSSEYRDKKTVTLKDDKARKDWKALDLGGKQNVTGVRILIQEVYQGSKYKTDVCISEVMFVQREN